LTLLGAVSEEAGLDRHLKVNTEERVIYRGALQISAPRGLACDGAARATRSPGAAARARRDIVAET
jgi:hypothetical protein